MERERVARERERLVLVKAAPFNAESALDGLRGAVTPTPLHYVRSNFDLPEHDGMLAVGGAVDRPLTLTLDELRAMPATTLTVTLECAGNGRVGLTPLPTGEPWTGQAVGTATWTGVPLRLVLARAAPTAEAVEIAFEGADHGHYKGGPDIHFVRSLAAGRARDPEARVLIAYAMNGEPLTPDHGAPLRLLVPGWYGMASVKWLARITALPEPYQGQFQTKSYVFEWPNRAWEPVSAMRVKALITDPADGATVAVGRHTVRGKAWSGAGPVARVEVSAEGAGDWRPATVEPPSGPYEWQDWSLEWEAPAAGRHVLRARATDAAGNVQPDSPEWNRFGYGNNAVQVVVLDAR